MEQEIIDKIREYVKEGKSYNWISRELKISVTAVIYNSSEEERKKRIKQQVEYFKNLPKEKKQLAYQKRKDYIKDWRRNKYQTDNLFRERVLENKRKKTYKDNVKGGKLKND